MNSIESWGAVIGLVVYFLFKYVGKTLNSPVDPEASTYRPETESHIPELNRVDDTILKKMILKGDLPVKKKTRMQPVAEKRFGNEFVESQLDHSSPVGEKVQEEETANIQLDFSDYDELKKGILYSEIFQRKY